jgi:hypothetical protein
MDWPFTSLELTAGLRRYLADPRLQVIQVTEEPPPVTLPSTPVRGLGVDVDRWGHVEHYSYLLTEPCQVCDGLPGAGRREIGFFRSINFELPVALPEMVAADPAGKWIILEPYPTVMLPSEWTPTEYRQSVFYLAGLHDFYWGLGEDLTVYPWMTFPLRDHFEVVCLAAAEAVERIVHHGLPTGLSNSIDRMAAVARLLTQADTVASVLKSVPQTLLHGDFWPANLSIDEDGRYVAYDWQGVSVGPGVLDLLTFVNKSQLYCQPLPVETDELIMLYRYVISSQVHFTWSEREWQKLWDHALMWRFLQAQLLEWADPHKLPSREHSALLEKIWLDPVTEAVDRWLEKYSLI